MGGDCEGSVGIQSEGDLFIKAGSRQADNQFLNLVPINLKKLPQMPASGFLNHSGRNWTNPGCSFYLSVSICWNPPVTGARTMRISP